MYMEDKMYSFTSALSAAAALWTSLPEEKEKKKFLRIQTWIIGTLHVGIISFKKK